MWHTIELLLTSSAAINQAVTDGRLQVQGAYLQVETGKVTKLPANAEQPRTVPPRRAVPFNPNSGKGVGAGPQASPAVCWRELASSSRAVRSLCMLPGALIAVQSFAR